MIWPPFTQAFFQDKNPAIKITHGNGIYLHANDGGKYIDAISSWWVTLHGHANLEIAEAIFQQAKKLEHVIFTRFSHDPAEKLTQMLSTTLTKELDNFFFSDNGSTAVEIALKMAYQYFKNKADDKRNMFLSLQGGYHGDTTGAMSVSDRTEYHTVFSDLCFATAYIDKPEYYQGAEHIEAKEAEAFEKLKKFLAINGKKICALIVEPLIQGAAGMRVYRAQFLESIVNLAREYGILIIFDEVMTGFFRTGTMFAFNQTNTTPDFVCLSKGLTGGFLPLSLTITNKKIYNAFYSSDISKAFMHGHSYTANPISCAAACASLEILLRKETQQNIKTIAQAHTDNLKKLNNVHKKRQLGTIAAFDVRSPEVAQEISKKLMLDGVFMRPLQNTLYLIPPYCIQKDELDFVYNCIAKHTLL